MMEVTLSANGSTASFSYLAQSRATFWVFGTFSSGTVILQASRDNGTTWITVPNTTLTANGYVNFQINSVCLIRATLSGATSPNLRVNVDAVRSA